MIIPLEFSSFGSKWKCTSWSWIVENILCDFSLPSIFSQKCIQYHSVVNLLYPDKEVSAFWEEIFADKWWSLNVQCFSNKHWTQSPGLFLQCEWASIHPFLQSLIWQSFCCIVSNIFCEPEKLSEIHNIVVAHPLPSIFLA